jgi:hypothetical protein
MISMTFSNKPFPKTTVKSIPSMDKNQRTFMAPQNAETMYNMQNNMIGRLMHSKKCRACPKH